MTRIRKSRARVEKGVLTSTLMVVALLVAATPVVYHGVKSTGSKSLNQARIEEFTSYAELENFVKEGLKSSPPLGTDFFSAYRISPPLVARPLAGAPSVQKNIAMLESSGYAVGSRRDYVTYETSTSFGSREHSTTNIQVEGVDEADIIKNDGKYIYAVTKNKVVIVKAYPPENASVTDEIPVDGASKQIFVNGNRLAVLGCKGKRIPGDFGRKAFVKIYDISNRRRAKLAEKISVDGNYFDSRMIDDYVYVIANLPVKPENIKLPRISSGNQTETVAASEVGHFDTPVYPCRFTSVISVNIRNPGELSKKIYLTGASQNLYVSLRNVYITGRKRLDLKLREKALSEVIIPPLPTKLAVQVNSIYHSDLDSSEKRRRIKSRLNQYMKSLSDDERSNLLKDFRDRAASFWNEIRRRMDRTVIYRISIKGGGNKIRGSGRSSWNSLESIFYGRIQRLLQDSYDYKIRKVVGESGEEKSRLYSQSEAQRRRKVGKSCSNRENLFR